MSSRPEGHARAPKGALVLMLAQLVKAAALFLGLFVLSRLLSPSDFGFVAVPVAIVGVGEIIRDLGISTATTTAREVSRGTRDVLLWINVALGLVLAILMAAGGFIFGAAFGESAYVPVAISLAFVFIINGVGAQYRAGLTRDMRFRALALADSSGALIGIAVAIAVALSGGGYWAIVVQQLSVALITVTALVVQGRWIPRLPRRSAEAVPILKFGLSVSWSQALLYLGNNADTFALGFTVPAAQLGYYTRSFQIAVQPFGIIKAPMTSVALPLLSKRRDDKAGYERAVLMGQGLIAYTVVPLAVFLFASAGPVVTVFLGDQWKPAIPIVTFLALAGAIQQLVSVSSWMFLSRNLGRALTRYTGFSVLVKVVLVVAAAPFGALAVAAAYLAAMVVTGPVALVWACRSTGVRVQLLFAKIVPPLALASLSGTATCLVLLAVQNLPPVAGLGIGVGIFVVVYGAAMLIPRVRQDYREIVGLVRPPAR